MDQRGEHWRLSSGKIIATRPYKGRSSTQRKNAMHKQDHEKRHDIRCYSALDRQTNEIRVLNLQPGIYADAIHGTLETHQLNSCPEFEALSYAWGNPERTDEIFLNGLRVMVTHSVDVALRHLRKTKSSRTLWIDAICINQTDTNERNHQVFLMNRVYSSAKNVLLWLGEANNSSDLIMNILKMLGEGQEAAQTENHLLQIRKPNESHHDTVNISAKFAKCQEVAEVDKEALCDLIYMSVLNRAWWSRLWVVQEVVLSKSPPIIMCGFSFLPWGTFMAGCLKAGCNSMISSRVRNELGSHAQWLRILVIWNQYQKLKESPESGIPLAEALCYTKDFRATDARDKVYGCLGLLTTKNRAAISPEYQNSVEEIYLKATIYVLEHDLASFYSMFSVSKMEQSTLPSWVPDFSVQKTLSSKDPKNKLPDPEEKILGQRCVSFRDDNKALAITGILFDKISEVIELEDDEEAVLNQIQTLENLTQKAIDREIPSDNPYYHFRNIIKMKDIWEVFAGGPIDHWFNSRTEQISKVTERLMDGGFYIDKADVFLQFLQGYLPGRYFFITELGFIGVSMARVCKDDAVTFLLGEKHATVLRHNNSCYTMLGAAHMYRAIINELFNMYQEGQVKEQTFLIR